MTLFTEVMDGEARRLLFVNAAWKPINGRTLNEKANDSDFVTRRYYYKVGKNNSNTYVTNFPEKTFMEVEIKSEDLDIQVAVRQILSSLGIRTFYIDEEDRDIYTSMEKVILPEEAYHSTIKPLLSDSSALPPTINELAGRVESALGGINKRRKLGEDVIFIADVPVPTDWLNRYRTIVGRNDAVPSVPQLIVKLAANLDLYSPEDAVKRKLRHKE